MTQPPTVQLEAAMTDEGEAMTETPHTAENGLPACGSCGEPAPYTITLRGEPMPACLRHLNHWRSPVEHGYGDTSDCLCGRNFTTVRGLREHMTKARGGATS